MSFVSPIFIFVFFPFATLGAYIIPGKARNIFILFFILPPNNFDINLIIETITNYRLMIDYLIYH